MSGRVRANHPTTPLGQGTLANLGAGALFTLSGVVASVVVGRVLGPASFATYGVVTTLVGTGYTYIWTGVKETVAQRVAAAPLSAPTVMASAMRVQLWAAATTVVAFVLLARPAARFFHDPGLETVLWSAATLMPPIAAFGVYLGVLMGQHRFNEQAGLLGVYSLLKMILVVPAVLLPFGLHGVYGALCLAALAGATGGAVLCAGERGGDAGGAGEIARAAWPMVALTLGNVVLQHCDFLLVRLFTPDSEAVGHYNAAATISKVLLAAGGSAFAVPLLPAVARAVARGGLTAASAPLTSVVRWQLAAMVLGVLALASAPSLVLRVFYGEAFVAAAPLLLPLTLAMAAFSMSWVAANALVGAGLGREGVLIFAAGLVAAVGAEVPLLARFGPRGAAWGAAFALCATWLGTAIVLERRLGARGLVAGTFAAAAAMAAGLAVMRAVAPPP